MFRVQREDSKPPNKSMCAFMVNVFPPYVPAATRTAARFFGPASGICTSAWAGEAQGLLIDPSPLESEPLSWETYRVILYSDSRTGVVLGPALEALSEAIGALPAKMTIHKHKAVEKCLHRPADAAVGFMVPLTVG
jgi:hypothetical protein